METPATYWAKRVRQSLQSFLKDNTLLIHCFSQCSKPFLQEISEEYLRLYFCFLEDDIKNKKHGDFKVLLLTLLDLPENEKHQYPFKTY